MNNWWGSIKKSLPEAVRQLPATYLYKSTTTLGSIPSGGGGEEEWEQIVELATGGGGDVGNAGESSGPSLVSCGEKTSNRDASSHLDDSRPLLEGWLAKQTILHSVTNRTPWRNRYFSLKRGCIYYYDVIPEDSLHLKHFSVDQENSHLPVKLEGTEQFGYLLTLVFDQPFDTKEVNCTKDDTANRKLHLAAESEEEKNCWLDWFVQVGLGTESELRNGWLMVRDKRTRLWKNRYFTLMGKTLHQHHRDQKGIFPLAGAEVWSRDGFSFSVRAKSGKILNLMADSQDVRDKWMSLIQRVIKHYHSNELHQTTLDKEDYEMIDFTHKLKDWVDTERQRVEKRVQEFLKNGSCVPTSSPDGKFRILSIDGGGMRGLMNCILLNRLLRVFPDLFEKVNFWVGTSNGGMLAMAFAFGYSPGLCRTILELAGSKVFIKREGYTGLINKAKFSSKALKILCDEIYGKFTLGHCPSFVLLPSLLLDNHSADSLQRSCENRYYHNLLPARGKDGGRDRHRPASSNRLRPSKLPETQRRLSGSFMAPTKAKTFSNDIRREQSWGPEAARLDALPCTDDELEKEDYALSSNPMLSESASDVVMRTIAAPTYFPSYQQHVDGGMFAHDPSSSALTLSISPSWLNKKLDEVILLSLGTGKVNHFFEDESHDWGYVQWVPKLAGVLWDGMVMQSEHICGELLGDRYFRFNPVLQTEIPLDNPEAVPLLVETALNVDLGPLVAWIAQYFYNTTNLPLTNQDDEIDQEKSQTKHSSSQPMVAAQGNSTPDEGRARRTGDESPIAQKARERQIEREREAREIWERKEQEERERHERMERMEREKKEREVERERRERENLESAERLARELQQQDELKNLALEQQRHMEQFELETRELAAREEEALAIERRTQQMQQIEETERTKRDEPHEQKQSFQPLPTEQEEGVTRELFKDEEERKKPLENQLERDSNKSEIKEPSYEAAIKPMKTGVSQHSDMFSFEIFEEVKSTAGGAFLSGEKRHETSAAPLGISPSTQVLVDDFFTFLAGGEKSQAQKPEINHKNLSTGKKLEDFF